MSKRSKKSAPGFSNFGFSTILLAFVMICIVTISALSLLTANSDYKLSQKVAEKNLAYYEASYHANAILSEVDAQLATAYASTDGVNTYYKEAAASLTALGLGTYDKNSGTFAYEVEISENQKLDVALIIRYPKEPDDSFYEIKTWKSSYDITEPEDETLNLID